MELKPEDIKTWRKKVNLSGEHLARLLEVSSLTVLRWEKGLTAPSPGNKQRLLRLMKKSEKEML